uniref:Uncharacterized protein n=1 Tax=Ixodes ricinus TaxID=34613 RepID=A0A6B0UPI7_IXORI
MTRKRRRRTGSVLGAVPGTCGSTTRTMRRSSPRSRASPPAPLMSRSGPKRTARAGQRMRSCPLLGRPLRNPGGSGSPTDSVDSRGGAAGSARDHSPGSAPPLHPGSGTCRRCHARWGPCAQRPSS